MPLGLVRTIERFFILYGQRRGKMIARWLVFLLSNYGQIQVRVPEEYQDHWLVEIASTVPTNYEEYMEWYNGLPADHKDFHPLKNEETLEDVRLLARHAFLLYTTLSGESWFPCQVLAYLYAISDQGGDDDYAWMDMDLDTIDEALDLFGRRGLFVNVINHRI